MSMQHTIKNISIYIIFTLSLSAFALFIVFYYKTIFLLFASVLFAIFLRFIANTIRKFIKLPYFFLLSLIFVILLSFIYYFVTKLLPIISSEFNSLWDDLAHQNFNLIKTNFHLYDIDLYKFFITVKTILLNVFNFSFSFLLLISFLFYIGFALAYNPHSYVEVLQKLVPSNHHFFLKKLLYKIRNVLENWILGQMLSMSVIGFLTTTGLWLLGIPYAFFLGITAAILTFIPNLGPILAAIPALLIAFSKDFELGVFVLILYTSIQSLESYLITPYIQKKAISLSPISIIITQIGLATIGGILGLAIATPLLAMLKIIFQTVYSKERLDQNGLTT